MPYDENLQKRIDQRLADRPDGAANEMTSKKMFGGLAYLYKGKMSVGIVGDALMARVPPEHMEEALSRPGARPMDFTGRVMKEFVFVDPEGFERREDMDTWIEWGLQHARTQLARTHRKKS